MQSRTLEAIYEAGLLRLTEPLAGVRDGSRVRLVLRDVEGESVGHDWIGSLEHDLAEEMRRAVEDGCEQIDPHDWR